MKNQMEVMARLHDESYEDAERAGQSHFPFMDNRQGRRQFERWQKKQLKKGAS